MRSFLVGLPVIATVFLPVSGAAQVYQLPTPAPVVTAANASWRSAEQPIYYAGGIYYPSGPTEFFDGNVMTRTGHVEGVPVYENKTLEPWSIVLVPTGGNLMQPYERRRSGTLVGTVGSRMPSQPIQRDVELSVISDSVREGGLDGFPVNPSGRAQWTWPTPPAAASAPPLGPSSATAKTVPSPVPVPVIRSLPQRETTNAGVYVDFAGVHHYSSGKAMPRDAARFARVGEVGGAAVFREIGGSDRTIYVEVVPDGLLAPYTRR